MSANTSDGARIVLFGASGTGKSSLLGALAQAEPAALGAQLIETSGGLAELQKRAYENKQIATQDEVTPYQVALQGETQAEATLIDSNGRVAQAYLAGERALDDGGPLAASLQDADAVVLTVAPDEKAQQTFGQFTDLLRAFEQQRGRRNEIAGLPVFLVLTKCDLLARPGDTADAWAQRIDKAKQKLGAEFKEFFGHAAPFGAIDLHVEACAIKRPALSDSSARPREPFGVAELFRDVLAAAFAFHQEWAGAERRLHRAVVGLVALIALMGLIAAGFFLSLPSAELGALENAIGAALPPSVTAAQRLREPVEPKLRELTKIQEDPEFSHLPSQIQDQVRAAAKEMALYQDLAKKVDALKRVRFFKKDEDIQTFTQAIDNITLPTQYVAAWSDTRLAKKIEQYRSELTALDKALADERAWLKKQTDEGDQLWRMAIPAAGSPERQAWIKRADAVLRPKDLTKEVPGVPNMKLRELYEFPSVSRLREDYDAVRMRVRNIRVGFAD
jgi:GTPase SAR1 family protein